MKLILLLAFTCFSGILAANSDKAEGEGGLSLNPLNSLDPESLKEQDGIKAKREDLDTAASFIIGPPSGRYYGGGGIPIVIGWPTVLAQNRYRYYRRRPYRYHYRPHWNHHY